MPPAPVRAHAASYDEAVPASRWLTVLLLASALGASVAAIALAAAGDGGRDRWIGVAILVLTAAVLLLVQRWFAVLHVRVDAAGVTARFGRMQKHIATEQIAAVEVERYSWLVYAGWGIRYRTGGRRAWSVPFAREGVAVTTTGGQRYFISSAAPERLRAAIASIRGE